MLHEYIITAFKVLVGLLNAERLVYIAIVGLGILLLWELFSLIFSFQHRFTRGVKEINEYISRNGIAGNSKEGLEKLISKMPAEFVRGYRAFERNHKTLPSDNIKRFYSFDIDFSGGVSSERLFVKAYVNIVFIVLAIFNVASVASVETSLTAYSLAEAMVLPLCFLFIAKLISYIYTIVRQNQYKIAVDEFNEMINNFDRSAINEYGMPEKDNAESTKVAPAIQKEEQSGVTLELFSEKIYEIKRKLQEILDKNTQEAPAQAGISEENLNQIKSEIVEKIDNMDEVNRVAVRDLQQKFEQEIAALGEKVENIKIVASEISKNENQGIESVNLNFSKNETDDSVEPEVKQENNEDLFEGQETAEADVDNKDFKDNFKPDFNTLLEPEAPKRGRGRPKKEVNNSSEFVIKNEKEFEEALIRAEKLMRKNEQPLSASQTKRIEKQIKELIDAMNKYKEDK